MLGSLSGVLASAGGAATPSPWATWNGTKDGAANVFRTTLSVLNCVTMLSASSAIVTWEDAGVSDFGFACACTLSGATITAWGTPVMFSNSSTITNNNVVALSSTQAIVCYRDTGDSSKGKAVVLDISGTTITVNTVVTFESSGIDAVWATKLTSSKVLVVYNGATPLGKAMVLDIASSVITTNTAYAFNSTHTAVNCVTKAISATQAIVVYSDSGNSSFGTAQVLDISGSTVTGNTAYVFNSAASTLFKIAAISSSKFAIIYKNAGDSSFSNTQILSIAGSVVSFGSPVRVINLIPNEDYINIAKADSQTAFILYRNVTTSRGIGVTGTILGNAITLNTPVALTGTSTVSALSCYQLDNSHVIVTYRDNTNSNKGTGIIASVV